MIKTMVHMYSALLTAFRPLLVVVLIPFALSLSAAESEQPGDAMQVEVKMIAVAPVQRAPALLAPNARTPVPPALLDQARRQQILGSVLHREGDQTAGDTSNDPEPTETIVLSAATPFHEAKGILTLVQPFTVHPETGIHMRGTQPGSVGVKVRVEQGNHYLVDFVVRSAVPGVYQLESAGESQEVSDSNASLGHVLLALSAQSTGWATVRLKRPESDFFLYSVEVTAFD